MLPLVVFLALGLIQLFLMLQARLLAEHAVFRAVRAGSLNHGDCRAMTHAAVVAVLPAIERADGPQAVADAFDRHSNNRYANRRLDHPELGEYQGPIIELWRDVWHQPVGGLLIAPSALPDPEDRNFDQPDRLMRLETRMIFWYRLKIPFADWVMGRAFLAQYRLLAYDDVNPLSPVESRAGWPDDAQRSGFHGEPWPNGPLDATMLAAYQQGHYVFPIRVTWSMRMMTPAQRRHFPAWECPL